MTIYWIMVGIVLIAGMAWLLYKLKFRFTEFKVKPPFFELIMKREPHKTPSELQPITRENNSSSATQEASFGGVIADSTIELPADAEAKARQKAKGEKSQIKNSHIKMK